MGNRAPILTASVGFARLLDFASGGTDTRLRFLVDDDNDSADHTFTIDGDFADFFEVVTDSETTTSGENITAWKLVIKEDAEVQFGDLSFLSLSISVSDGNHNSESIEVKIGKNNPPLIMPLISSASLDENVAYSQISDLAFSVTDQDEGDDEAGFTFALFENGKVSEFFEVVYDEEKPTYYIQKKDESFLDFETATTHDLTVQAFDQYGAASHVATFTINVQDVEEDVEIDALGVVFNRGITEFVFSSDNLKASHPTQEIRYFILELPDDSITLLFDNNPVAFGQELSPEDIDNGLLSFRISDPTAAIDTSITIRVWSDGVGLTLPIQTRTLDDTPTSDGDDVVDLSAKTAHLTINTGDGDDSITTGSGDDYIEAGKGADTITLDHDTDRPSADSIFYTISDVNGIWAARYGADIIHNFVLGEDKLVLRGRDDVGDGTTAGLLQALADGDVQIYLLQEQDGNGDHLIIGLVIDFAHDAYEGDGNRLTLNFVTPRAVLDITQFENITKLAELFGDSLSYQSYVIDKTADTGTAYGTDLSDELQLGQGITQAYAFGGDDKIKINANSQKIYGGAGRNGLIAVRDAENDFDVNPINLGDHEAVQDVTSNARSITGNDADNFIDARLNDNIFGTNISGLGGHDTLHGGSGKDTVRGGSGDDFLYGHNGGDSLSGNKGDDHLYGGDGKDTLYGDDGDEDSDEGHDHLYGGRGDDKLYGRNGHDHLYGDEGNDLLLGAAGNDSLYGGEGDDELYGLTGADLLDGGDGNDKIFAGDDIDEVFGGAGHDLIIASRGADKIDGGSGFDIVDYSGQDIAPSTGINVNLSTQKVTGDIIGEGDEITNVEMIIGTKFEDSFVGDYRNTIFQGGEGADSYDGGDGYDTVSYEDSDAGVNISLTIRARLIGNNAPDADYYYQDGYIHLQSSTSSFVEGDRLRNIEGLIGSHHDDWLQGNGLHNLLIGGGADDTLMGKAGDDLLVGGTGNDRLVGGIGDDIFQYFHYQNAYETIFAEIDNEGYVASHPSPIAVERFYPDKVIDSQLVLSDGTPNPYSSTIYAGHMTITDFGRGNDLLYFSNIKLFNLLPEGVEQDEDIAPPASLFYEKYRVTESGDEILVTDDGAHDCVKIFGQFHFSYHHNAALFQTNDKAQETVLLAILENYTGELVVDEHIITAAIAEI